MMCGREISTNPFVRGPSHFHWYAMCVLSPLQKSIIISILMVHTFAMLPQSKTLSNTFKVVPWPTNLFAVITTLKGTTLRRNWDVLNTITVTVPWDPPGEDKQNKPQQTNIACRHTCVTMPYTHTKSPKHKWWASLHPCGGIHCKLPRENSHKQ